MIISRAVIILFLSVTPGWAGSLQEGRRLLAKGQFREAAERFQAEARNGKQASDAYLLWGLALVKQQDFRNAELVLRKATTGGAKKGEAHNLLGWVYLEGLQDPRRAVAEFKAAAAALPNSPEAHNNLGTALDRMGEFDRAVDSYTKALALKPDYPEALGNRGWAYLHANDRASAQRDFVAALSILPGDSGALSGLAYLSKERGDWGKSARAYRKLLSTSPNFVYLLDLLEVYVRQYWLPAILLLLGGWTAQSLQKRRRLRAQKEG